MTQIVTDGDLDLSSFVDTSEGSYHGLEPALKSQRVIACATNDEATSAGIKSLLTLDRDDDRVSNSSSISKAEMLRAKLTARQAKLAADVFRAAAAHADAEAAKLRLNVRS